MDDRTFPKSPVPCHDLVGLIAALNQVQHGIGTGTDTKGHVCLA